MFDQAADMTLMMLRHGNIRQRQWAIEWLSDRGFGKPLQAYAIYSMDEFVRLVALLAAKARELLGEEGYRKVVEAAYAAVPEIMALQEGATLLEAECDEKTSSRENDEEQHE